MRVKTEAFYVKEIKKQKQKTQIRVSGQEYAFTYMGLHTQPSCMRTQTCPRTLTQKQKCRKHSRNKN